MGFLQDVKDRTAVTHCQVADATYPRHKCSNRWSAITINRNGTATYKCKFHWLEDYLKRKGINNGGTS